MSRLTCLILTGFRPAYKLIGQATIPLIFFTITGLTALGQMPQAVSDQDEIKGLALRWQELWNRHDIKALSEILAEDVDLTTVTGRWLKSRKEFQADHSRSHQTLLKESVLTNVQIEVKLVRPDLAVTHYEWTIRDIKEADGRLRAPQRGISIWVLEKRKGRWSIIAAQNTIIKD